MNMPNSTPTNTSPDAPARAGHASLSRVIVPALWMVAGVLIGVALFRGDESSAQSIIRGMATRADAGMVSHSGTYALMTNESGNEDLLVILDQRTESVLVYRGDAQKGIELEQRLALPKAFEDARLRNIGRP